MSDLSAEQLERITKNRELALLRKRKANESAKVNPSSCAYTLKQNGPTSSSVEKKAQTSNEKNVTSQTTMIHTTVMCKLMSYTHFTVDMIKYHEPVIELFKTIPGKIYEPQSKRWSFPLSSYEILVSRLSKVAVVVQLPKVVVSALREQDVDVNNIDLSKIDSILLDKLLPFQEEGIRFGISKKGRCLIADDMGLGKTIQALGIAHYYQDNWPLLILCPSSMRFPWEEAIHQFLPSVNPYGITVMTSSKDLTNEAKVVICSYDLFNTCFPQLSKKAFGVLIMDESHFLKSIKASRTQTALKFSRKCERVILLSGTPALSRPMELFTQILAIYTKTFLNVQEFGIRYCAGVKNKYGWNFTGSSNTEELELFLRKKIMIRRLKSDVITQLPPKIRKVVILNPDMVQDEMKRMKALAKELQSRNGKDSKDMLLVYFSATSVVKSKVVCEYIQEKLHCGSKMLVFAHHATVINAVCEMLVKKGVDFIKIDGSTNSELRKTYCDTFQRADNCLVAVLSLKAANAGITLTAANLVIFAELYWNPGELTQAEDRAHRIGQRDSVVVEYLVAKGTADEHIWGLVQHKLNVLNKVGLSKDSFEQLDTKHMKQNNQRTINSMFESSEPKSEISSETNLDDMFSDDFFFEKMEDDDLFQSIQLEEIENRYYLERKKCNYDVH